jgi:rRNA maturation protein Nop10
MRCPVCEAENPDTAAECRLCGKALLLEELSEPPAAMELMSGLERTSLEVASAPSVAQPFPELERTSVSAPGLEVDVQPIEIQRSEVVVAATGAAPFWDTAAPDLTLDRALDDGLRTPAPAGDGLCAYCGEYSLDAICANCGQRRDRFTSPPPPRASAARSTGHERVLCPACFARVPPGPRCIECGVSFPPSLGGAET